MISRLSRYNSVKMCTKCGVSYNNDVNHCMFECSYFDTMKNNFNAKIARLFDEQFSCALQNLDSHVRLGVYLGSPLVDVTAFLGESDMLFYKVTVRYISDLWTKFLEF